MANPSLKAQIEAAKSALTGGLATPSSVGPPPQQPTAPIMTSSDIATDANTKSTNTSSNNAAKLILANPISANEKPAHSTNAAALDERITRLEAKLLDNQRDLYALLQKIREISRLQANSGQNHKKLANDQAKAMVIDEAKDEAVVHRSQRSPVIMVAMVVLIGLGAGITYFLATGEGDPSALKVPRWISTIIDHFNRWIG